MTSKISLYAAAVATMLSIPAMADARSMRAVGSSTVYPFAKMAAERVARANPKLGTPIIESTGTGAGMREPAVDQHAAERTAEHRADAVRHQHAPLFPLARRIFVTCRCAGGSRVAAPRFGRGHGVSRPQQG